MHECLVVPYIVCQQSFGGNEGCITVVSPASAASCQVYQLLDRVAQSENKSRIFDARHRWGWLEKSKAPLQEFSQGWYSSLGRLMPRAGRAKGCSPGKRAGSWDPGSENDLAFLSVA